MALDKGPAQPLFHCLSRISRQGLWQDRLRTWHGSLAHSRYRLSFNHPSRPPPQFIKCCLSPLLLLNSGTLDKWGTGLWPRGSGWAHSIFQTKRNFGQGGAVPGEDEEVITALRSHFLAAHKLGKCV